MKNLMLVLFNKSIRNSFLFSTEMLHAGCEALGSEGRSPKLQGSEVPPPWVEGTGFKVQL